jgi:hypothetical protein
MPNARPETECNVTRWQTAYASFVVASNWRFATVLTRRLMSKIGAWVDFAENDVHDPLANVQGSRVCSGTIKKSERHNSKRLTPVRLDNVETLAR